MQSTAVLLIASSAAFAQTTTPPVIDKDQDLPVEAPVLKVPPAPPKPPEGPTTPPEGPPPTIYGKDLKTESGTIIYVLDISSSMYYDSQIVTLPDGKITTTHRLGRAKQQLSLSIASLPKSFKFNVLAYSCYTYFWEKELVQADDANKARATKWVNALVANGGTGTGPAVVWALLVRANKLIVLLTDGAPNCGAGDEKEDEATRSAHLSQIRWANEQNARIDVFGISATDVFKQFCVNCAAQNGGSYTDVR
ncbi:MAG: hypothetical protein ACAI25_07730 [Planctomycetota bacterium]